jgi:hypothetical protein
LQSCRFRGRSAVGHILSPWDKRVSCAAWFPVVRTYRGG